MIFYEEEYRVKITKIPEYLKLVEEFEDMVNDLKVPYLKEWHCWQERYVPGSIKNVWIVEEQGDIDRLWDVAFVDNQKWAELAAKIFELMVDGSYKFRFWKQITAKKS